MDSSYILFGTLLLLGCTSLLQVASQEVRAECDFKYVSSSPKDPLEGIVTLIQKSPGEATKIQGTIKGFPAVIKAPRIHGMHIHDGFADDKCSTNALKGHFNPDKKQHPKHAGDLGNIIGQGEQTEATVDFSRYVNLAGDDCIIGKAMAIDVYPSSNTSDVADGRLQEHIACCNITHVSGPMCNPKGPTTSPNGGPGKPASGNGVRLHAQQEMLWAFAIVLSSIVLLLRL